MHFLKWVKLINNSMGNYQCLSNNINKNVIYLSKLVKDFDSDNDD
jgi:hypothetical protein